MSKKIQYTLVKVGTNPWIKIYEDFLPGGPVPGEHFCLSVVFCSGEREYEPPSFLSAEFAHIQTEDVPHLPFQPSSERNSLFGASINDVHKEGGKQGERG